MVLQVTSLSKSVDSVTTGGESISIINDVNLSLSAGESCAIMGASGSGKSTLLALLAGLEMPTSGDVRLLGQSLNQLTEEEKAQMRLQSVGFIFQAFHLIPTLTALHNVAVPLQLRGGVKQKEVLQRAAVLLKQLGLVDRQHHFPNKLSGGEQQRVAIARAMISQPAILFADEPTGNLDRKTSDDVCEQLFQIQHGDGSLSSPALVIVTHDPKVAQRCQRTLYLEEGTLRDQP